MEKRLVAMVSAGIMGLTGCSWNLDAEGKFKGNETHISFDLVKPGKIRNRTITIYFDKGLSYRSYVNAADADNDGNFERVRYIVPQDQLDRVKIEYDNKTLNEAYNHIINNRKVSIPR